MKYETHPDFLKLEVFLEAVLLKQVNTEGIFFFFFNFQCQTKLSVPRTVLDITALDTLGCIFLDIAHQYGIYKTRSKILKEHDINWGLFVAMEQEPATFMSKKNIITFYLITVK